MHAHGSAAAGAVGPGADRLARRTQLVSLVATGDHKHKVIHKLTLRTPGVITRVSCSFARVRSGREVSRHVRLVTLPAADWRWRRPARRGAGRALSALPYKLAFCSHIAASRE